MTFFHVDNTFETILLPLGGTSQFVGYYGAPITSVHFQSFIPTLNPGYISNQSLGYFSYTLVDNVTINGPTQILPAVEVPEVSSLVCWGLMTMVSKCGLRLRRRLIDRVAND